MQRYRYVIFRLGLYVLTFATEHLRGFKHHVRVTLNSSKLGITSQSYTQALKGYSRAIRRYWEQCIARLDLFHRIPYDLIGITSVDA